MSDANVVSPIYTHKINGVNVRYFKSPRIAEDGKPDLPWAALDDVAKACGYPRFARKKIMTEGQAKFSENFRKVLTADGIVLLIITDMISGLMDPAIDVKLAPVQIEDQFLTAFQAAAEALTKHLSPLERAFYMMNAVTMRKEGN